jgi:hypothetical protein
MLLAIGNIRAAESMHPYSQVSSSFLSDFLALSDIIGAEFFTERALAHQAFVRQKAPQGFAA